MEKKKNRGFIVFWKDFRPGKLEKKCEVFDSWDEAVERVGEIVNSDYVFDIRIYGNELSLEERFEKIKYGGRENV